MARLRSELWLAPTPAPRGALPPTMSRSRLPRLAALALTSVAAFAMLAAATPSSPAEGRVVVLGFDGADARTVERMMGEGRLPNLSRLAEQGTFSGLVSTNPAESAAGWAALNTGMNPAKNGVPSFIIRDFLLGGPGPNMGHLEIGSRPTSDFELWGLLGVLAGTSRTVLAVGVGLGVLLAFSVVFGLLLRLRKSIAFTLAAALGAVGAWGAVRAKDYVPSEIPGVYRSRVEPGGFWEVAAGHGVSSIVLDAALAFGRPSVDGTRVLGGLGLPDVRGGISGEWFIYTTDDLEFSRPPKDNKTGTNSGNVWRVDERDGRIDTRLYGPRDFWSQDRLQREQERLKAEGSGSERLDEIARELAELKTEPLSVPLEIEKSGGRARVTIGSQVQELAEGEWSDWYRVSFPMNPLLSADAVTRVQILSMDAPFRMYVGPLQFDPAAPAFWQPVSQPPGFSADLSSWIGSPFETLGWSCMTNELKDAKQSEVPVDSFLQDIEFTMGWRRQLARSALQRDDWRLFFGVFSTPDRLQHMMYKYYDPLHPEHDAQEAAREVTFFGEQVALKDTIPAIYEQIDAIVGEVMDEFLRPEDTLLLCADHGFTSYRRGMHVNNWLVENGYMTLKDGLSTTDGVISFAVDWSRTRAYAVGLGMVFLNLEGREPEGIVKLGEADALLAELSAGLLDATDPGPEDAPYAEPVRVVKDVVVMKDLYPGPWGTLDYRCADLMIGFDENYRVSWTTVSGNLSLTKRDGAVELRPVFANNRNNWCGDHASNSPQLVQGIFFSNRPVQVPEGGVSVMQIAPTALDRLGVPIPADYDMGPLVEGAN